MNRPTTSTATRSAIQPATRSTMRATTARRAAALAAVVVPAALVAGPVLPASAAPATTAPAALVGGTGPDGGGTALPATFRLTGGGYGHGVGMSQYGAQAQALAGRSVAQILGYYYTGTALTAVRDDAEVRVRVLGGVPSAGVSVRALDELGGRFLVSRGSRSLQGRPGDRLTLRVTADGVRASLTSAGRTTTLAGATLTIRWQGTRAMKGGATTVAVDGSGGRYRWGRIEASRVGGALNVVNVVRLHDEYLAGIAEVPASWAPAALQAQAVAARTYAVRALARGVLASCACHLEDDTRSQVFRGWDREGAPGGSRWAAAVRATAASKFTGRVVTYRGTPIDATYFSSDGGATENSEDVWAGAVPYLRSVPDPWSAGGGNPLATWTRTRTQGQVARAFGLPDVVSLDLSDRTGGGSVRTAVATASTGRTARLTGYRLAGRLSLPARWLARPARRIAGTSGTPLAAASTAAASSAPVTAVVAGGAPLTAEAAVAAPLARHLRAPLVLVPRDGVPASVRSFLAARHVTRVLVVGGTDTVSAPTAVALAASGVTVTRIAGADRYATAALVAARVGAPGGQVVTASGEGPALATAVAAAAVASASGRPLLLVRATGVPEATAQAYRTLGVRAGVCAGDATQVPDAVLAAVPGCRRVTGVDRPSTAAALVRAFDRTIAVKVLAVSGSRGAVLADGVAAAALGLPLVYAWPRSAPPSTVALLRAEPGVRELRVFGSRADLPTYVVTRLRRS